MKKRLMAIFLTVCLVLPMISGVAEDINDATDTGVEVADYVEV